MTPEQLIAYITTRSAEEGECLIWQRDLTGNGYPTSGAAGIKGSLRRAAFEAFHGQPAPAGCPIVTLCGNPRCLAKGCLKPMTPSQFNRWMSSRGLLSTAAGRIARARGRRSWSKLGADSVEAIRRRKAAGETQDALAAAFGVSRATIGRICRRETWSIGADPWAGLRMAA